jgi:hypothetical protein
MIKVFVVIFFIFNILACNPIQQASQKKSNHPQSSFICLASQSSCDVNTDIGTFTIEFSGQAEMGKVKTELPFKIRLKFDGMNKNSQLTSVNSYLEGKSMFMGKIPVFFQLPEKKSDYITAETLLASCSEDVMTWRLWFAVEIEQADKTTQQDFFIDFDSKRL